MPHKKMERQYQLQAQKRNDDLLKFNYYKEAADYFQRETVVASQFSSWNSKDTELNKELKQKLTKAENLRARRDKLKKLLQDEEEILKSELNNLEKEKNNKSRSVTPSLEDLRRKLKEKRAEENLYYPRSCRRINLRSNSCSDVNSFYHQTNNASIDNAKTATNSIRSGSVSSLSFELPNSPNSNNTFKPNPKYAARYSRRSLENTNISEAYDNQDYYKLDGVKRDNENKENRCVSEPPNLDKGSVVSENGETASNGIDSPDNSKLPEVQQSPKNVEKVETPKSCSNASSVKSPRTIISNIDLNNKEATKDGTNRSNSSANLSVKMFRFLKHNDIKRRILEMCRREHQACMRQSWDEALKLRKMCNKLIVLKNKNLYDNNDLIIDEDTKRAGLDNIKEREQLLRERDKDLDILMYSDGARHLWKKWVIEDDALTKKENLISKDAFLKELEDEWKRLAHRDKKRMSLLFDRVMTKSALQDEHELLAIIRSASIRN